MRPAIHLVMTVIIVLGISVSGARAQSEQDFLAAFFAKIDVPPKFELRVDDLRSPQAHWVVENEPLLILSYENQPDAVLARDAHSLEGASGIAWFSFDGARFKGRTAASMAMPEAITLRLACPVARGDTDPDPSTCRNIAGRADLFLVLDPDDPDIGPVSVHMKAFDLRDIDPVASDDYGPFGQSLIYILTEETMTGKFATRASDIARFALRKLFN